MHLYPEKYPLPYLLVVSAVFALVGGLWIVYLSRRPVYRQPGVFSATFLLVLVLLISSFAGALIWIWHDIMAGFFPPMKTVWFNIKLHVPSAPAVMLFSVLASMPLSALAFSISVMILNTTASYSHGPPPAKTMVTSLRIFVLRGLILFAIAALIQLCIHITYMVITSAPVTLMGYGTMLFTTAGTGILMLLGLWIISLPFLLLLHKIFPRFSK